MYGKSEKGKLILFFVLLTGVVIGSFIGYYVGSLPYMQWLDYGLEFGSGAPHLLKLGVIDLWFGLKLHVNVGGIIGLLISIFIYKQL